MGYALGADDYLTKPVDRELLLHVLKKYTGHSAGRVLVVEDDDDTRDVLKRTLEQKDLAVLEATNGQEGLERAASAGEEQLLPGPATVGRARTGRIDLGRLGERRPLQQGPQWDAGTTPPLLLR